MIKADNDRFWGAYTFLNGFIFNKRLHVVLRLNAWWLYALIISVWEEKLIEKKNVVPSNK